MDWAGVEPAPPDFQSGASTELASNPEVQGEGIEPSAAAL